MKKLLALLLVIMLAFGFVACKKEPVTYKLGMAVVTKQSGTDATADGNGLGQSDSVFAAVLLDKDGKIVACKIDTAQSKLNFTAAGVPVDADKAFMTKKELKDDYGMRARSGIGKEWYEQAEALEAYVVGKTSAEVAAIAVSETTAPTDADLSASVTIKIGDYKEAIIAACADAAERGSLEGDKLGIAAVTTAADSVTATADGNGNCYFYTTYVAVSVNSEGKVTAAITDATQSRVAFDVTGKITTDFTTATVQTKRELGDAYNMLPRSGIGKEWYQQAQAYNEYIAGKTAGEITAIALDESGKATDADLLAGVTITIGDFKTATLNAISYAK